MKKLLFYWYVHPTGWNDLYDIHLKYLNIYKNIFDEKLFIIAHDEDTPKEYIDKVVDAIKSIIPDANFKFYRNDKMLRESLYFYNEVATKLDTFDDQWIFFAHNKGVDSRYARPEILKMWIEGMYFMNLNYMDIIEHLMEGDTCVIGTYLIANRRPKNMSWLTYNYHFSGTYWWFNPKRICDVMKTYKSKIPNNDRYFTESLWGTIIPNDYRYIKPALDMYQARWKHGFEWMPELMKSDYLKLQ